MKRKLLCTLLCLALSLSLLPAAVFAAEPTKLKSVDITIELPKAGDLFDQSFKPTVTSFKSGDIDLLATGAGILEANWRGDNDLDENGTPYFRAGGTYYLTFKLMFNPEAGYCANYKTASDGWNLVMPDTFSATVNGQPATVSRNPPQYYPVLEAVLTLDGEVLTEEQRAERKAEWEKLTETRRAMYTPRTWEESKAYNLDNLPEKVVVVNTDGTDLNYDFKNMTTLVLDVNNAEKITGYIAHDDTLKEIWLSPESNALSFVNAVAKSQWNSIAGMYEYSKRSDILMYTAESTLFVSEAGAQQIREWYDEGGGVQTPFIIKIYSGNDVLAAQKAGASAAKDFCTTHKFTTQIATADRVYTFDDGCQNARLYYYSCAYCGTCEYDPNHVDYYQLLNSDLLAVIKNVHKGVVHGGYESGHSNYGIEHPNDSAYIGVNDAGEHVWWTSCAICGKPYSNDYLNVNEYDHINSGLTEASFAEYKALEKDQIDQFSALALASVVERYPNTFTLPLKSDAKMSEWAQSDVNLALNDDLLDTALLGNDYTKTITRLQFCSIAVRLAETLIGKELTSAPANTFTDTDSAYALKAYTAGITTGTGDGTFSPNATLTRQQMATFIYRTLRYVEQHSDYSYTDYTSKLASYSDSGLVQSWATEAMAFMNALDLIKGTSDTTLSPEGLCTIEQAVTVAERSVYAHLLGWYQVSPRKTVYRDGQWYGDPYAEFDYNITIHEGDYVWVTDRRYGVSNYFSEEKYNLPYVYVEIINPFNGQIAEMKNGDLIPVRG